MTAHPAFDKAASYFGIEVIHIPVDKDGNVSPKAMEAAINNNTIMVNICLFHQLMYRCVDLLLNSVME